MPKKTVTYTHVYEYTFRTTSNEPLDRGHLADQVLAALKRSTNVHLASSVENVDVRELLFEEDDRGNYCLMTEGHRGRHESPTGYRWGDDL